jgi:outer membrane immunogenic protein
LVGVESDFSAGSATATASGCSPPGCAESETRSDWQSTTRGRVGFIRGNLLLYGTGGVAFNHTHTVRTITSALLLPGVQGHSATDSGTDIGWVAGGGLEWQFAPNYSVKLEYLRLEYNNVDRTFNYAGFPTANRNTSSDTSVDTIRVGLNYRFDWHPFGLIR